MLEHHIIDSLVKKSHRIIITGASGWLGLATLDLLHSALGADEFARRVICLGSAEKELVLRGDLRVRQSPLTEISSLPFQPTWVLHFAFLTKDRAGSMNEADYRETNRTIARTILDALDPIGAEAVFLASSGAAGRADDPSASADMRLYAIAKLEDEQRFSAWADAAGRRLVIGRIFALTGPFINKHEAYAIASFILDGLAGRTITIRARRPVIRAYVAIRELMSLVFALLEAESSGVARFESGGEVLELEQIALVVARAFSRDTIARAQLQDCEADRYHGDCQAYARLFTAHRVTPVSLAEQVDETIDYLRTEH